MALHKHCVQASLLASAIALTGCGSDSDSKSVEGRSGTPFSALSISAIGGSSTEGNGANGGSVDIFKTNSATDLKILKESSIDTSYELAEQTPAFGINPIIIETTQTIQLVESTDDLPGAGELYMVNGEYRLYKSDGTGTPGHEDHEVTGLTVNEGASLFLPANYDEDTEVRLMFNNDIVNNGVIASANDVSGYRDDINLTAAAYYGTGDILTNGEIANYYRQSGGDVSIFAHTIINSGLINTSGANKSDENTTGNGNGAAGSINLSARVFVENTGELRANGGNSDSDASTDGGDITMNSLAVYNTGDINANSGSGTSDSATSNSADVELTALKELINTGNISVQGADANDSGNAGRGGNIQLYLEEAYTVAYNQSLINTGNLTVDGGSITGESTGAAGNGGDIYIGADAPDEEFNAERSIQISGNLSANGGSAIETMAGNGGEIEFDLFDVPMSKEDSYLVGYQEINVSGGNGMNAGEAGDIDIIVEDYRDASRRNYNVPTLSGSIHFDTDLIANGGNTIAGTEDYEDETGQGNDAGNVFIAATNYSADLQENDITVTAKGTVSANGGQSFDNSSQENAVGGNVTYVATHKLTVSESISVNGGVDTHTAGNGVTTNHAGSHAGNVGFTSQFGDLYVDTEINGLGGSADLLGGNGSTITAIAKGDVDLRGTFNISGGNAITNDADAFETEGGNAGYVMVMSEALNSNLEATVNAETGSGDRMGNSKVIYVDADCLSKNCELEVQTSPIR